MRRVRSRGRAGQRRVGPSAARRCVPHGGHQEGQGHHDGGAPRPPRSRRAAHRAHRLRVASARSKDAPVASTWSSITARSTHAKGGPTAFWNLDLALLDPPRPKNLGLDPRPARSRHRKTKTRPHDRIGRERSRPRGVMPRGRTFDPSHPTCGSVVFGVASSGSARACTGPSPGCRGSRPAPR